MDSEDRQRKVQAGKEKFAELMRKKTGEHGTKKSKKKKAKVDHSPGAKDDLTVPTPVENISTQSQPNESFGGSTDENTEPRSSASEDVSAEVTEPTSFISDEASTEEASKSDELPTGSQEDLLGTRQSSLDLDLSHEDKPTDGAILENLHSSAGSSKYEVFFHTGSQEDLLGVEDVVLELDGSQQEQIIDEDTIKQQLLISGSITEVPVSGETDQKEFDLKIILEEYKKKLNEYQAALSRRDEVIQQLSERLKQSLQTQDEDQAEAALQAEALAQEISILRQQLVQAREILSRQKSSTGISPQQLLEAQNSLLLLSQESSRKDGLIKDLCSKLAHANGQLEGIRAEMGQELQLCQEKLHSLEQHCIQVDGEENSETATVDTQTDTWELEEVSVTPSACDSSLSLISRLGECQGNSAALKVMQQLELSVKLQEKLNNELRNLHNSVSELTKDFSDDPKNIYCVPDVTNSYEDLESKLAVLNSTMQSLLDCASNADADRSLGYASKRLKSLTDPSEVELRNKAQFVKQLLAEEIGHLKSIYSNHTDLQIDLETLRRTFSELQNSVQHLQGEQCVHRFEEFQEIKLLSEKLEYELNDVKSERDQLKKLVSAIKESLNDATLLIHELRSENSNLLIETDRLNTDIYAAKEVLINSALGFSDELNDPFAIEPCVKSLCSQLEKAQLDYSELNLSIQQMTEKNDKLNKEVVEYKEKFESEKQEKELMAKKLQDSNNETPSAFLLSSLDSSTVKQPIKTDFDLNLNNNDRFTKLQTQYEELVQEKMTLELQLNAMQNNSVSLSVYEAAKQEIERLERAELRLCAILEENDLLQKRIDHLEHDLNELLQSNSHWKKETNQIEQELMTKLIEMELTKGELEAQLQEKEMLLNSAQSANTEYKCQLNSSLESLSALRNGSDSVDIWESHKNYLLELATLKQKLQLETEFKLALEARVAYYKTKSDQLETLHNAVREQLQQIREQLQSVWNQQDGLRRELVENMMEKEAFQKEIINLRNKLEFMVTDKETEGIRVQHISLLGAGDSPDKRTPALSEHSSSIKELFEQDSINSSFDYSDSLASESVDTETKKLIVEGSNILANQNSVADEVASPIFAKDTTSNAHLKIALELKDLYINDLQLQILEAKMEQNNQHCLQSLELQECLLEQQRNQTEKSVTQIKEVFEVMDSCNFKNKERALEEMKEQYDKKHAEEILAIHTKYQKEMENLILQSPLMSCNNNEEENIIPSLKHQALQVLECQKRNHLSCLEQELRLENIKSLEKCKAELFDLQRNNLLLTLEKLENENQTLRALIKETNSKEFPEKTTEDCCLLLEKFITQLNTELMQHSLMVQSKWSKWFSETLNTKSSKIPQALADDTSGLSPVECLSQLTSEMKEKETWLQVSSAMQEAVQLYVEHLSSVKSVIADESTALLKLKDDILKSFHDQEPVSSVHQSDDAKLLASVPHDNSLMDTVDLSKDISKGYSTSNTCSGNCALELQTLEEKIIYLKEEINNLLSKHTEELQAMEQEHCKEIQLVVERYHNQHAEMKSKRVGDSLPQSNIDIKENAQLAAEFDGNGNINGSKLSVGDRDLVKELSEKHTSEINELNEKHRSELEKMKVEFRTEHETISELCQKHSLELQEIEKRHLLDVENIQEQSRTEKEDAINGLIDAHSLEIKDTTDKHLAKLNVVQEEMEILKSNVGSLTEKHATVLNEMISKHAAEIAVLNENFTQKTVEMNNNQESVIHEQHEAEINNLQLQLKEHFDAEKAILVEHYEAKLENVLASHTQELEGIISNKSEFESHNRELRSKIEELTAEYLQNEADLKTQIHIIIEDHEVELKNLEEKYLHREKDLRDELQAVIDNLQTEVEKLSNSSNVTTNWEEKYNQLLPVYEETLQEITHMKFKLEKVTKEHELEIQCKLEDMQTQVASKQLIIVENAVSKCKEEMELLKNKCLDEQQEKFLADVDSQKREWKTKETQLSDEIVSLRNNHQDEIRHLKLKLDEKAELKTLYSKLFAEHKKLQEAFEHLKSETEKRAEIQEQLNQKNSKLNQAGEELAALHLQHTKELNDVNEKFLIEMSEVKIQHEEKLQVSLDEAKNAFEDETSNLLHQHSKGIAVWERRLNGLRHLLTVILEKLLETCILMQGRNENEEGLLRESVGMLEAYICELDVALQNNQEESSQDVPVKLQQNMLLDLDNFLHEKLGIPPCDISFVGKLKETKVLNEVNTKPSTTDASTSFDDDANCGSEHRDTLAEVEKLRLEIQQNMTDQDVENANLTEEIRLLTDQIAQLESQNVSLKHEVTSMKSASTSRTSRPPARDWLAGTELSSVEFDSWQVHAAQTNSRLLHVLSDLVKTFVDTEQHIQMSLARLGLSVFQTSDSSAINDEDGPASGQFLYGSREDFGSLCQPSGEGGLTFEMCEDGPDLTPRAWDLFASAFKSQDVAPEDDVVLGASRRLRLAVDQVLCLLSELMELQSLQDLSIMHQKNEELSAELKEEEKAKMEAQAHSLKLEGELRNLEQESKSLKDKLEESEQQSHSLWQELEGARLRLGQLEVTHEGLAEEKRLLLEQSHLLASGLQGMEQRSNLGEEEICDDLLLGQSPGLVAENTRLLGEKRTLQEKQEYEKQQLSHRLHQVEVALEEAIAQKEELQERLGREIMDLKCQMEAMEKQLHSNKKFIEEQGHEREQEREEYSKEIRNLKESLKEKDKTQFSEVALFKEVESLELQLRSKSDLFLEACERRDELEGTVIQQKDKILDLQEVITELEKQIEEKTRLERDLKEQIQIIRAELSEQDRQQEELSEHLSELQESQMRKEQGQHIRELEEQLESRNQEIQHLQHYNTLIQEFRGQLHVLDERVESKCRHLERFTWVCALSPVPSEDTTSASDYRDPDKAILLIQEGGRVLSPASAHWEELRALENRIDTLLASTEELMKRHRELENQYKVLHSNKEEIALERSILQEQLNDQFLQISTLKTRLEEKRFGSSSQGAKATVAMEMTQLREELQDATAKCDSVARMLQETKSRLSLVQRQLQEKTEQVNSLQSQLLHAQAEADESNAAVQQLQDRMEDMKKEYEFKLQFDEPIGSKSVSDNFTQTEDNLTVTCQQDDIYQMNWKSIRCENSVQVGTPFNQLDIIPEVDEALSNQESLHSLKIKERLRSENQSLRRQNQALEEQSHLQKDFNTLQVMVTEKDEELTALSQDIEDQELLKHEISLLQKSLTEKEEKQATQKESLSLLEKEVLSLQGNAKKTVEEISCLKESLESKSSQLDSWRTAAQEHKLRADQLKQSLESLTVERACESKSADSVRQKLEQEVNHLQKESTEWSTRHQQELEKRQQEINRLEAERDGLKLALESTSKKLQERETQAQKSRRAMELKALREQRAHQEQLIKQMQDEHTEKQNEAENQIQVLLAKLQAARECQEVEKTRHKESISSLLSDHQQELQSLARDKDKDLEENAQQVSVLREEVQRLKQQLLSESQRSLLRLHSASRESTPDSDGTTMSSSCTSTGGDDGLQILPPHIQKLFNRLLKEGKEVLSLTESKQKRHGEVVTSKKEFEEEEEDEDGDNQGKKSKADKDRGDAYSFKEVQCNLLSLPAAISETLLVAKDKLLEKSEWLQHLTVVDVVSSKQDLLELVKSLFSLEKKWLLEQIEDLLSYISTLSEQNIASVLRPSISTEQLLTRDWWNRKADLLTEKHSALIQQLISVIESSQERKFLQQSTHGSPEIALLLEQLDSCRWQIQKQKELLEYSQQHEESQRQEFQNHLEQEKINSNQLSGQLREWRKRCSQVETALSAKQSEVTKLSQAVEQARRDLGHCRSDLDLEKFHGQQLLHALESERRNFHQVHAALYSERQRKDATHRRDMQLIKHLKSVLHAHGLGDKVSPLSASLAASPVPDTVEPTEMFRNASVYSVGNSLTSFGIPAPESMECIKCSWREHQSSVLKKDDFGLQMTGVTDTTLHQHPQMAIELLRLRRHRDSLCFQKRYLLRLLSNYQETEAASLSALGCTGVCTPPLATGDCLAVDAVKKGHPSLRVVSITILSIARMKKMLEVLKELRARQGMTQERVGGGGRQRWRHGLINSQTTLIPSSWPSEEAPGGLSLGSPRNGAMSPTYATASSPREKLTRTSSFASPLLTDLTFDSSSLKSVCSGKSEPEQRRINDRRFEECVERLEFLHQRMGLNSS